MEFAGRVDRKLASGVEHVDAPNLERPVTHASYDDGSLGFSLDSGTFEDQPERILAAVGSADLDPGWAVRARIDVVFASTEAGYALQLGRTWILVVAGDDEIRPVPRSGWACLGARHRVGEACHQREVEKSAPHRGESIQRRGPLAIKQPCKATEALRYARSVEAQVRKRIRFLAKMILGDLIQGSSASSRKAGPIHGHTPRHTVRFFWTDNGTLGLWPYATLRSEPTYLSVGCVPKSDWVMG